LNFWRKKYKAPKLPKLNKRKQKVANNKLRIKGKFVTVDQAIKLIGKRQTNHLMALQSKKSKKK
jgi:hypothetical protein